jgi:hypothetical protein
MVSVKSWLARYVAMGILMLGISSIRVMVWFYNCGLMSRQTTDLFFRFAKLLEKGADRLTSG